MSQAAPNGGDDADNGYRDEFEVPDFVPEDYDGPIAREDSTGQVRRLCLHPKSKGGLCDNYANTCTFHDTSAREIEMPEPDHSKPRPFKSIQKHKEAGIEATKDGLKDKEVADIMGISPGWFSQLLSKGRDLLSVPDDELNEYERELVQFTKSFNRAKAKGTQNLVNGMIHDDDVNGRGVEFVLERSRGWFNTERHEVDQTIGFDDDEDEGYEIIDAEGGRVHPDRSKEAREKRNREAQEKMAAMDDDDRGDMPTPAAPESNIQDADFREIDEDESNSETADTAEPEPDTDSSDASESGRSNSSGLTSGGRTRRRGPLDADPDGGS